jgi:hypothetical protein
MCLDNIHYVGEISKRIRAENITQMGRLLGIRVPKKGSD